MDAYVYQAALLCTRCAHATMFGREAYGPDYTHQFWPRTWQESDYYPQGPYADGGGEADSPQHCDHCGLFLQNPLTGDGNRYVNEKLTEYARDGSGTAEVLKQWSERYNSSLCANGLRGDILNRLDG